MRNNTIVINETLFQTTDLNWGYDILDTKLDNIFIPPISDIETDVYILDTGIKKTHEIFNSNVIDLYTEFDDYEDRYGHGTHVASIVKTINPKVNLYNVKILSDRGSGWTSGIIRGLEAVEQNIKKRKSKISVINMSLGGPKNTALNAAVDEMVRQGIKVVVAAGNSRQDIRFSSPSSCSKCIVVGSIDKSISISSFSNFGNVTYFAPGSQILGASISGSNSYVLKSGTSMAAPMVSGLLSSDSLGLTLSAIKNLPSGTTNKLVKIKSQCEHIPEWLRCRFHWKIYNTKRTKSECIKAGCRRRRRACIPTNNIG